jgi:hypothetical protein
MAEETKSPGLVDASARDLVLRTYFDELRLLQSEMDKRFERQANAFNLFVLVLGALLSGTLVFAGNVAAKGVSPDIYVVLPAVFVFLPWLTTPLAAMYFNDELMIGMTARYVSNDLAPLIDAARSACFTGPAPSFARGTLGGRLQRLQEPLNSAGTLKLKDPRRAVKVRAFLFALPFIIAAVALLVAVEYAPGTTRYVGQVGHEGFGAYLWVTAVGDALLVYYLWLFWQNHRSMESPLAHEGPRSSSAGTA